MPQRRRRTGCRAIRPTIGAKPTTCEVFTLVSWRDRRLAAISQAGLVEKFVDALVWVFYPVFLYQRGLSLPESAGSSACTASSGRITILHRQTLRPYRPPQT